MNIAEQFGIGVSILMFKTDLRKALEQQGDALEKAAEPLAKIAAGYDRLVELEAAHQVLKKLAPSVSVTQAQVDLLEKVKICHTDLVAEQQKIGAILQEVRAA